MCWAQQLCRDSSSSSSEGTNINNTLGTIPRPNLIRTNTTDSTDSNSSQQLLGPIKMSDVGLSGPSPTPAMFSDSEGVSGVGGGGRASATGGMVSRGSGTTTSGSAPTTTISTIAVQSGNTRIVLALLQVRKIWPISCSRKQFYIFQKKRIVRNTNIKKYHLNTKKIVFFIFFNFEIFKLSFSSTDLLK